MLGWRKRFGARLGGGDVRQLLERRIWGPKVFGESVCSPSDSDLSVYVGELPLVEHKSDAPIAARCCVLSRSAAEGLLAFLEGIFSSQHQSGEDAAVPVLLTMLHFVSRTAPRPCVVGAEQGVPSPPLVSSSLGASSMLALN